MDLSFHRLQPFGREVEVLALPGDLAVLLGGVAARQAASPTAMLQARLMQGPAVGTLLAPLHGAFEARVAALIRQWKDG